MCNIHKYVCVCVCIEFLYNLHQKNTQYKKRHNNTKVNNKVYYNDHFIYKIYAYLHLSECIFIFNLLQRLHQKLSRGGCS